METRRLIGFGRNSFVMSLPRAWVDRYKLQKGDELYIHENGDSITIAPNNLSVAQKPKEVTLSSDGKQMDHLETEITWAYLSNFDIISVRSDQKFPRDKVYAIKAILQNLAGMEIMEETSNKIMARDLINVSQVSIEKTIRRVDIIVRGMMEDSILSLREDHYESIADRDTDVNRLVFLAYRIMRSAIVDPARARELQISFIDILTYWHILMRLEKIGDQCKRIARFARVAKMAGPMKERIQETFQLLSHDYGEVMKVFYTSRREEAFRLANKYRDVIIGLNAMLSEQPDPATVNIIEQLKSMTSSVKHIARSVIGGG